MKVKKVLGLFFYYLVQWTWGFVQSIAGLCLSLTYRQCRRAWFRGARLIYHDKAFGGVSLGMFIFVNAAREESWIEGVTVHEYGHTLQSMLLGPLYFLVIGLPSAVWCNSKIFIKLREEKSVSYYRFYTEKWANRWGERVAGIPAPESWQKTSEEINE